MKIGIRLMRWFYRMSWKKVSGIAVSMMIVAVVPISLQVANTPTRTRTEAALVHPKPQEITTEFETPSGPPEIYLVDHFFGKVGDAVLIHGKNLGGVRPNSSVKLAGEKIGVDDLVTWTGNYIEFKVPIGARSGQVEVDILGKKTTWPGIFFVNDTQTQAELGLTKVSKPNQAMLTANNINGGKDLLVWLLIVSDKGTLKIEPQSGVNISQKKIEMPMGSVYEIKVEVNSQIEFDSVSGPVNLALITKSENQVIGIARGELSNTKGEIKPLTVNPLYVSF